MALSRLPAPGECGGVLWPPLEDTARLADLTRLLRATGEAGGIVSEGDLPWRASAHPRLGELRPGGEWPRDIETPGNMAA